MRITSEEAKEISSRVGEFRFFSIKDKQTKRVRFIYKNESEVECFNVHQLRTQDGKTKTVDCIRKPNEPVQNCPFCGSGEKLSAKAYIFLVSEDDADRGTLYVFERNARFLEKLEGLRQRYGDLNNCIFEIERKGAGLDTTYEIYFIKEDKVDINSLPEVPSVHGKLVQVKSAEEMEIYIATGNFPDKLESDVNQHWDRSNLPPRDNSTQQPTSQQPTANNGSRRTSWY